MVNPKSWLLGTSHKFDKCRDKVDQKRKGEKLQARVQGRFTRQDWTGIHHVQVLKNSSSRTHLKLSKSVFLILLWNVLSPPFI